MSIPRLLPALLALVPLVSCGGDTEASLRPQIAFVTNGVDPFWVIARAGVKAAAVEFDVDADVRMPADATDQKRILEELLTRGVDGIAVSPIDGVNQNGDIDAACEKTYVITHDSDAPGSKRLCYVGMDNYLAGRECGKLVKEAIPGGGKVIIFVGRAGQDNARLRRQGVIDELLDRSVDSTRHDPVTGVLEGGGYTIVDTRTDDFDKSLAKSNAENALAAHPDLACMVGLFAYNTPLCLEAIKSADKLGQVKVASFDEADATLQGILDGHVQGTVTQQPYMYGYESVRILAALAKGEDGAIPESGYVDVPVKVVKKENAQAFWDDLKAKLEAGQK